MKLTFWGAARTVTGSMHLLEVNGYRLLLDCGLFQGKRQLTYERNLNFPFDPASLDAVVLSHAHIDHSGNLPNLVKQGFANSIWSTPATRDLSVAMLQDSGHIQQQDAEYINRKRQRDGLPPIEPLYTRLDAVEAVRQFITVGYRRPFLVVPGVTCQFLDAGHILGSAIVVLDITEGSETRRLVFSGDLGRPGMAIIKDPETVAEADFLIMESTYGNRRHESRDEAQQILRRVVNETYKQRGKVIIPAFAVGRTQELVYNLHVLSEAQKIPVMDIFVDSPLAVDVTEIFRTHPECYDSETLALMEHRRDPFGFRRMRYIRDVEDSKSLNFLRDSAVIISASGMCESGRILHHLKNNIEDSNNTVLFSGFQAEHTLGRRIRDGNQRVRIFGEQYDVRANVEAINGYSAHADSEELLDWVRPFDRERLQKVFLVHGELESATALSGQLYRLDVRNVEIPERGQSFDL
ncbi:MAG: MBL fold metallo-hydrolase [Caldilineae bacterium]|nr:MBL fold metallo-hydrolase [Anaerolineae bacterium]MCB0200464.1 MBL fold metallo-hydrolase [Anaerolineae bacterium]MCB0252283.1 MBL fold metallo-hydrolase [Anaerolineae bacterium]MCB9154267.1 MBL fold metallo-hydrolase [Caldilineae bacterium]